jgi:hypothetical protein
MQITPAEQLMAEGENLDVKDVHTFMCNWERYCDKALDLPAEEYEALWIKGMTRG